jgi:hypothetical protein
MKIMPTKEESTCKIIIPAEDWSGVRATPTFMPGAYSNVSVSTMQEAKIRKVPVIAKPKCLFFNEYAAPVQPNARKIAPSHAITAYPTYACPV